MTLTVAIQCLPHAENLPLPEYATADSAGMDLCAAVAVDTIIAPHQRVLVPTGIAIALPAGYEAQIRPRSGLALKYGITCLNTPGTIDADYRGEIKVLLINHGDSPFIITRGMRIAQMVVAVYARVAWQPQVMLETSVRGVGGFGSTGTTAIKSGA